MGNEGPVIVVGGDGGGNGDGGGGDAPSAPAAPPKPPIDQYISDTFDQDAVAREKASMFAQAYTALWGEPATENYVVQAVKEGLNLTEFVARERMKDAFQMTTTYKDEARQMLQVLRDVGGV